MILKILPLCVILQIFVVMTRSENRASVIINPISNPEVEQFLKAGAEKFTSTFFDWGFIGEDQSDRNLGEVKLGNAEVTVVNGEKVYTIKFQFTNNNSKLSFYSHAECTNQIKTNATESMEVGCYFYDNRKRQGDTCVLYYDTRHPDLSQDCQHNTVFYFEKD